MMSPSALIRIPDLMDVVSFKDEYFAGSIAIEEKAEAEKNPTDPSTSDDNIDQNDSDIVDADFEDLDDQKK